jgi:hypothetical protein
MPVGTVDLDRFAFGKIDEIVGEEAAFDAVDAKVEAIAVGGGGDGVGPGLRLAPAIDGYGGEELAGGEVERLNSSSSNSRW